MNDKKDLNNHIYIIGFPKSGNTWLARLVAETTKSNILADDIVNTADNSIDRRGNYIIHKEHVVQDKSKIQAGRVVYIFRDVRDVLISGFYHNNRWCNDSLIRNNTLIRWYFNYEIKRLNNKWVGSVWSEIKYELRCLLKSIIRYKYDKVRVGGWSEHTEYWTNKNVVLVQYEKLLESTEHELQRVLHEMGISVDERTIKSAVKNQSFKSKKNDFLKNGDKVNAQFLRSGTSGSWKDLPLHGNIKNIEDRHQYMMNKLGYKSINTDSK